MEDVRGVRHSSPAQSPQRLPSRIPKKALRPRKGAAPASPEQGPRKPGTALTQASLAPLAVPSTSAGWGMGGHPLEGEWPAWGFLFRKRKAGRCGPRLLT